jgi:D-glycero-D-manno-heptose 1,7-bisphosphate phosphatase
VRLQGRALRYHTRVPLAQSSDTFAGVRTVFLDRDGVINRKAPEGAYVSRWDEFEPLPGVAEAIRVLNQSGRRVFVVSNQRGVSLGLYSAGDVDRLHAQFAGWLGGVGARVDGFFFCPHGKDDRCQCRKPLPGLFEQAFSAYPDAEAGSSVMVGDSLSDIEAGQRLGMRTIFVEGDPERQKGGAEQAAELADAVVSSLSEAVRLLGEQVEGEHRGTE